MPEGRILISESPIATFFSEVRPSKVLGSKWLPDDREEALKFIEENVAFVIYMGVPYYKLRMLFPELQDGKSWGIFHLVYDANDWETRSGAHRVYVYEIVREPMAVEKY